MYHCISTIRAPLQRETSIVSDQSDEHQVMKELESWCLVPNTHFSYSALSISYIISLAATAAMESVHKSLVFLQRFVPGFAMVDVKVAALDDVQLNLSFRHIPGHLHVLKQSASAYIIQGGIGKESTGHGPSPG